MTAPADATWTAVPMRWALVRAGDVVLDPDGSPWMVTRSDVRPAGWVEAYLGRGEDDIARRRDPDATVPVLVPTADAAAVVTLRAQLGDVRVLDRNGGA